MILENSPFKTKVDLLAQFDKIYGLSGTLFILFNIIMNKNGRENIQMKKNDEAEDSEIKAIGL